MKFLPGCNKRKTKLFKITKNNQKFETAILPFYIVSEIPKSEEITWKFALQEDIDSGAYQYYNPPPDKLKSQATMRNRKQWEINYFTYIIEKYNLCKPGKKGKNKILFLIKNVFIWKGLGFAVGRGYY